MTARQEEKAGRSNEEVWKDVSRPTVVIIFGGGGWGMKRRRAAQARSGGKRSYRVPARVKRREERIKKVKKDSKRER